MIPSRGIIIKSVLRDNLRERYLTKYLGYHSYILSSVLECVLYSLPGPGFTTINFKVISRQKIAFLTELCQLRISFLKKSQKVCQKAIKPKTISK